MNRTWWEFVSEMNGVKNAEKHIKMPEAGVFGEKDSANTSRDDLTDSAWSRSFCLV